MGLLDFLTGGPKKDPIHITDDNFEEEIVKSELPVMLDAWGPDCPWCLKMVPTIKILTARYEGKVKVGEFNVLEATNVARRFGIRGTPTILLLKKGVLVGRFSGYQPEHILDDEIKRKLLEENNKV
ncbi:MAG: thioredoxin family protein [Deltaproteobacteria bacterium]|nr:thioredoxin family protein [Deltaproteobacteria bacterium]